MITKKLNYWQACWFLYLVRFNFTLCHQPRQSMKKLDALSWRLDHGNGSSDNKNMVLLCPEFLAIYTLEEVELMGAEQSILSKVCKGNHFRDLEKPVAKAAQELQCSAIRMVHLLEWLNINSLFCFQEKVYILWTPNLSRKIVSLYHNTKIAGHPSKWKMLELVFWNY